MLFRSVPALCHQMLEGKLTDTTQFATLANKVSLTGPVTDLNAFATAYLDVFSRGYNYAFGIAAIAMVISLLVYIFFNKHLPGKQEITTLKTEKTSAENKSSLITIVVALLVGALVTFLVSLLKDYKTGMAIGLFGTFVTWIIMSSTKEEKARVISLVLVFFVVIFFWMSFHQNGLTLTVFARDYIVKEVGPFTNIFFTLPSILSFIAGMGGLFLVFGENKLTNRFIGAAMTVSGAALCYYFISKSYTLNAISPEVFQSFNPLFIVFLTPMVMGVFAWLNKIGKEPSTPRKIGIGMIIAAIGFLVVLVGSLSLISPHELNGQAVPDSSRVNPYWLISSYLVLTIAELFLSPMGLSFVSKVAPQRFQGLMQGGWLLATAVGNKLLFVGSFFWDKLDLWQLWLIFIVCCLLSASFIFSIMKRLERVTN